MIHHRTAQEVRRFDIFKLIVTIVLLLLLLLAFIFRPAQPTPSATQAAESGLPAGAEATTEPVPTPPPATELPTFTPAPEPQPTSTPEPTPTAKPQIAAPALTAPSAGDILTAGELIFSGTGDPGSQVQLLINGAEVGQATTGAGGEWSFETILDEPGDYELTFNALNDEGNVAASSEPVVFTVEVPPIEIAAPTLNSPAAGDELTASELTLSGTGTPDTEVEIVANGQVIGTATVGSDGEWSLTATLADPGDYEISLNALDDAGNIVASSEPVTLTLAAPEVEIAAPTFDSSTLSEILQAGEVTLTGTGTPGSEVEIVLNGEVAGTATVGDDGQWNFPTLFDEAGDYDISLNALDANGDIAASSDTTTFTVETEEAAGPVCEEEYVVVADDWLSKLADKYWADVFLYPAIVAATNQKNVADDTFVVIDNPDLIEPGWKLCIVDAGTAVQLAGQ